MRRLGAVVLLPILATVGVMLGAWWAPFALGLAFGIIEPRARIAVPVGALIGLVGWLIPLATLESRFGLGPAANSLAAIMGFGHQGAIPIILTLVVGLLLGLTGAWLGSALSFPLSRVSGRGSG
jgi:ABC-type xylose transport system permease subunit